MSRTDHGRTRATTRRRAVRVFSIVGWFVLAAVAWALVYALLVLGGH
jgi:hypothetical protein